MLIKAYQFLQDYDPMLTSKLFKIFNKMAVEVCEGQQMDMDFESRENVQILEYFEMIKYKTSVLIGAALQMGGLIGGMDEQSAYHLYQYGVNVGIAFQMQDDVLDTFGEPKVGKQPGGDIIQNKKTYLYLKTLELVDPETTSKMKSLYNSKPQNPSNKVEKVRSIMKSAHVLTYSDEVKGEYKNLAFSHLDAIKMSDDQKSQFRAFGDYLLSRSI